jgi:cysteinyl-tRNA synthetase
MLNMLMRFYNTRTKTQENLTIISPKKVGMYVCGPTVYASPHIGNARSVVVYDLLFRLLQASPDFDEVTYVRNITDVDDKINKSAKERGITIQQLTTEVTKDFHEVMSALGCLPPTREPRATEHIPEMVNITQKLIENGHAYVAEGHVLFDVTTDPDYGKLSGRSQDEMLAGARVEVAPYKRNPGDFVLWKPADAEDDESAKFDSPWGKGRPGWHIECTAMSTKYLGESFDIHGGGLDLTFPHHENEVAQACCAFKGSRYANFWIHNGFLTVNGEKMSKSLGNFITVRDLLDKGINGEVIRWALLSTHYRGPLDWSDKLLSDSKKQLDGFYRIELKGTASKPESKFLELLADDLNVSKAFAYLNELLTEYNKTQSEGMGAALVGNLKLMGFLNQTADQYFGRGGADSEIENLINLRKAAKSAKNYAEADRIRAELDAKGILIDDKPGGVTEWRRK